MSFPFLIKLISELTLISFQESHVSSVSTPVTLFYNATHTVSAVKQAITELAEDTLALAFSRLRIHPLRRRNRSRYASISDPQLTDSFLQNSTYSDTHSSVISLELQREAAEGGDNQIMKMLKRRRLSRERKGRKNWLRFAPIVKSRMEQWRKENKGGHEDLEWSVEEGEEEEEEEGELATKAQEVEVTEEEFTIGEGALDIESDCSQIQRPFQWEWEMRSREY